MEIAAPPSTPFVVQESRCLKSPCLVCWLQAKVAETAATKDVKFSTTPLQLNIVGVRSEDSLSNRFDDVMVAFFQLLPPESKPAFEKAIEVDLREDMAERLKEMKRATNGQFRYVACSQQGLWVVGLFAVTTDPGFEDSPEALEAQKAKYQRELAAANEKEKALASQEQPLTEGRDKAKAARAAMLAKRKKGAPPPTPELPGAVGDIAAPTGERASLDAFIRAVEQRLGELEGARRVQGTHPGLIEKTQAALDKKTHDNEVRKGNLPTYQYHKGWVEQGRAIVPVGHHADAYRFYLHKAGSASGFPRATVALSVPSIKAGMRVYSVKHLCTAPVRKLQGKFGEKRKGEFVYSPRELRQVWPASGPVRKYASGLATLELVDNEPEEGKALPEGTPPRGAFLVEDAGKKRSALPLDAQVVVTDEVNGTNIHRAHNVKLSQDRTKLEGYEARSDAEVNSWSEGCQTFTDFYEFNGVIRLSAVSKRWLCANKDPMCIGAEACMRLQAGPGLTVKAETDMKRGEKELLKRFDEPFILRAISADCLKDADDVEPRLRKARQERDTLALTEEEQQQLSVLETRKVQSATKEARAANPKVKALDKKEEVQLGRLLGKKEQAEVPETAARIKELDAQIQEWSSRQQALNEVSEDALNEVRLLELPGEIEIVTDDLNGQQAEVDALQAVLDAVPKKGEKPMSPAARKKRESALRALKEDLDAFQQQKAALEKEHAERGKNKGLTAASLQRKRDFLRERAQTFQADFLRSCDLDGTCKVKFHYTLIELPAPHLESLKGLFKDERNSPWRGEFVMGEAKP